MTLRARGVVTAVLAAALSLFVVAGCGQNNEPKPLEKDPAAQNNAPDDQQQGGEDGDDTPAPDSGDQESSPGEDGTPGGGGVGQEALEPVDAKTASEVKKFIQRYMDVADKGNATGDVAEAEELATDDCSECRDSDQFLKETYAEGGRVEGGLWENPKITVRGKNGEGNIEVSVEATLTAFKVYDSSGRVTRSGAEKTAAEGFTVAKKPAGWRVVAWTSN